VNTSERNTHTQSTKQSNYDDKVVLITKIKVVVVLVVVVVVVMMMMMMMMMMIMIIIIIIIICNSLEVKSKIAYADSKVF
jgi:hypothetical protein